MKKLISILLLTIIGLTTIIGCSRIIGNENTEQIAKVLEIDGTKVTVELEELGQSDSSQDPSSEKTEGMPPEKPDDSLDNNSQSEPPQMPNDSNSSNKSGDSSDSKSRPEPPEMLDDSTESEKPEGSNNNSDSNDKSDNKPDFNNDQNSMKPDGMQENDSQRPEPPNGNSNSLENDFNSSGKEETYDLNNTEIKLQKDGKTSDGTIEDIKVGSLLSLQFSGKNVKTATVLESENNPQNSNGQVDQGSAANTIDKDTNIDSQTYESTEDDQNALKVSDAKVELNNITVKKSSGNSSNTDSGNFYGLNAALLATDKADVTIKNSTIESSAQNANGVFSYGEGTTVNVSDTKITTSSDNSGGIQTTGGGTTNAKNLTVQTSGNSSAAIRSDRGGGTVSVDGGEYISNGLNSPSIYSTAAINVKNAKLQANNSESLVIEGKNSIELENCNVSGNMSSTKGVSSDNNVHNIMIYQSMSGDADIGNSSFKMVGGSLTGLNGDMFYITNTDCSVDLEGINIDNRDANGNLFTISGNNAKFGWGKTGSNGAKANITTKSQTVEGKIVVDTISTMNLSLTENSNFTGSIQIVENTEGGNKVENNAIVKIDEGSTWTLTEDCKITDLDNKGTINFNGHTITLENGTVLK